jgi:hypothetical protein
MAGWIRLLVRPRLAKATADEVAVLRSILSGADARFGELIGQLERAPGIKRENPTPDTFRVAPTSTFDDLSFPLKVGRLTSAWVTVRDAVSERVLQFRVAVGRHGFLLGLEGRSDDGRPWPSEWRVDSISLPETAETLALPTIEEQRRVQDLGRDALTRWLGTALPPATLVYPPVGEQQIRTNELELHRPLPPSLREFLRITNGLDIGWFRVHAMTELYEIANLDRPLLTVAWDSDEGDDFVVALSPGRGDSPVYRLDVHQPDPPKPVRIAEDFRNYLRERLAR